MAAEPLEPSTKSGAEMINCARCDCDIVCRTAAEVAAVRENGRLCAACLKIAEIRKGAESRGFRVGL